MSIFLAGLVFCYIPSFALSALYPRDNEPLQPIHIPLALSNQQYVVKVAMSSRPQVQNLPFVLSTAIGYTAVAGTSCDSCDTTSVLLPLPIKYLKVRTYHYGLAPLAARS